MYSEYLTFRGFEVVQAADGKEALQQAITKPPDLILLDLVLPGFSGLQVLRTLRADPVSKSIPIVILSGAVERKFQSEALEAGANLFLGKPCMPEDMETAIRRLVGGPQERQ